MFEEVVEYTMVCSRLRRLGDIWEVLGDLMDEQEAFTCALYGNPRTTNLNLLHYKKLPLLCDTADSIFKASESIDFPNLPPCLRGVKQHIKHVNYEVAI